MCATNNLHYQVKLFYIKFTHVLIFIYIHAYDPVYILVYTYCIFAVQISLIVLASASHKYIKAS